MSNLNKLDFVALKVSRRNYLKWTQDVKLHLTAKKMRTTIKANNNASDALKVGAMIFIRKHMDEALQVEYLTEKDRWALWVILEEQFNHQRTIFLPEARNDWSNLRFQDFKYVNEYNSEVCRIQSFLKFCGKELTKADLLEKTFSTFHPSYIVLQQQYKERNFTRFSELITTLLLAEKNNNLLMKNDQARPTSTRALPEANAISYRDPHCERGNRGTKRMQGPIARDMGREVPRGMAHMTEANVVKAHTFMAHVVGTTVHRSQKNEMR